MNIATEPVHRVACGVGGRAHPRREVELRRGELNVRHEERRGGDERCAVQARHVAVAVKRNDQWAAG